MEEKTDPTVTPAYDASEQQQPAYPPPGEWQQPQAHQPMPVPVQGPVYPQSQPMYPQPQPTQPGAVVIQQQPQPTFVTVPATVHFTDVPAIMQCPSCRNTITTVTSKVLGGMVWMTAAILCFLGLFFLLCCVGLIPFCIPSLMDTVHTCPNCNTTLGKHSQL